MQPTGCLKPAQTGLAHRFPNKAIELGFPYVSLIWHPRSLERFDLEMKMLKLLFAYVQEVGIEATTYEREWQKSSTEQLSHSSRKFRRFLLLTKHLFHAHIEVSAHFGS